MRLSARVITALSVTMCASALLSGCASSAEAPAAAEEESPLTEFFSAAYGADLSQEEQQEKFAEDEREREDLVAQCMTEEGFEYTPNLQASTMTMSSGEEWDMDSREWVAQYGYGMVNYPGKEEMQSGDAGEYVDANADYVAGLSPSEQEAFNEALYGPAPDPEDMPMEGEAMEYDWTTAGCYGWAENERGGVDPMATDEHKPLMDAMNEFYENSMSSPELAAIDAEWASCMADAGRPGFTAQTDAQTSINEEMNAFYEEMQPPAGEMDLEEMTAPPMPDEAAMAELGEKEIELALVDLDCREKTDYRAKADEVRFEQEQQFVDDHRAELDALKADLEQDS